MARARAAIVGLLVFAFLTVAGIRFGPSPITGDETEYYAMTYAWATNASPTLTPAVLRAIRTAIPGRPQTEPAVSLARDGSYNAIHFWFLSLLATPFFLICRATGLDWRHCFAFLNALVFAGAAFLALRRFRWSGLLVVIGGLVDSPLFPYLNKAHGETFSVSLMAIAAMLVVGDQWLEAAVALSVVAAQVSAFSPLAVVALGIWWFRHRRMPHSNEWAWIAGCALLLALQPTWTLWRYHKLNVIVAEGYVFPEMATPKRIGSILIDPDVGLLFIWPMSVVLIAAILARRRRARSYWLFAAVVVAVIAYVGAQQMNYTTSAPRYALWFVPLLLVGFAAVATRGWIVCFAVAAALNAWYLFHLAGPGPNLQRKPLAELWYRYLPSVWDPDEQVFADLSMHQQIASGRELFFKRRFPIDALPNADAWAISNSACTKVLVFGYAFTSSKVAPVPPIGCEQPFDSRQLLELMHRTGWSGIQDGYATTRRPATPAPPANARTFEFRDANGWQDLDQLSMAAGDCYVTYNQPRHELSILREDGTISLPLIPGRRGELKSGACTIDPQSVSIAAHGESLGVTLPIPAGSPVRTWTTDREHFNSDIDITPSEPDALTVNWPAQSLSRLWLLVNDRRSEEHACYIAYDVATRKLQLMSNDGDRAGANENGRCIIDPVRSMFTPTELRLDVKRKGLFDSPKRIWERHQRTDGALTSWQESGIWPDVAPPITVSRDRQSDLLRVEVSPTTNPPTIWVLINDRLDPTGACYITYESSTGALYLNESGRMLLSEHRVLANRACQLDAAGSSVRTSERGIILALHLTHSARNNHIWVADQEGTKVSPWIEAGLWR